METSLFVSTSVPLKPELLRFYPHEQGFEGRGIILSPSPDHSPRYALFTCSFRANSSAVPLMAMRPVSIT